MIAFPDLSNTLETVAVWRKPAAILYIVMPALLCAGCAAVQPIADAIQATPGTANAATPLEELPILPLEQLEQMRGAVKIWPTHTALHTHDPRFPIVGYSATGEVEYKDYDAILFPTYVVIVLTAEMDGPIVFLARSPHGGCNIRWDEVRLNLTEGCYGSRWNTEGEYLFGPALQDLDRLPGEVRDGMIWVRNEIIEGQLRQMPR